jgi:hypothetical protein
MKKLLLVLLVAIIAIPTFQSCKKGENDPFISLKSRKARLVGEWTLKDGSMTFTYSDGSYDTYTLNGSSITHTEFDPNANPTTTTETNPFTEKVTFRKDGSFQLEYTQNGILSTQKGGWFFGRKNKELDLKNKETVCLAYSDYTSNGSGSTYISNYTGTYITDNMDVWQIDQLKSKEMTIIYDGTSSSSSSISTTKGTMTFEK